MNKIVTSQDKIKEIEILEAGKKIVDAGYDIVKEERFAEIKIIDDKYAKSMSEFSTKASDYNQTNSCNGRVSLLQKKVLQRLKTLF